MALGSITLTSAEIPVEPSKTTFGSYFRVTVEFTADDDLPGAWSISPTSFIGCGPDGIVYTPLLGSAPASIGGDRLATTQVTAEDPVVTGTVLFAVPPAGPRDVVFAAGPDGPLLIWSLAGAG